MILKGKPASRVFLPLIILCITTLRAGVVDTNLSNIVTIQNTAPNQTQKKLQSLSGLNKKTISGIKINIVDLNIGKNSALKIDYSPKLNHEGIININNHKQTTVKFQYNF